VAQVVVNPEGRAVLLVVAGNKIADLPPVITALRRHTGFDAFHVVCPPDAVSRAQALLADEGGVRVIDEEAVIPGLSADSMPGHLPAGLPGGGQRRIGCWYYQQFLKMGYARFAPQLSHYLVWDGDTVPLRPLSFQQQDCTLLTTAREYHRDYFRTLAALLPQVPVPRVSHISQHMLVHTGDMQALLAELSSHGMPWWQFILRAMNGRSAQQFSEFETYAAYCLARWPQRYRDVRRRWLRAGRSYFQAGLTQACLEELATLYDFVAFEDWDDSGRRRRRALRRVAKERLAVWMERRLGLAWYPD